MSTPKLHEVLAVEGDLAGTAKKILDETRNTFSKKPDHFMGEVSRTEYFDADKEHLNQTEQKAITESVPSKLDYMAESLRRYYNAFYAKEASNQHAVADIVLDTGAVLFAEVPATVLLGLETRLKELRSVIEAIPTLQPGVHWHPDASASLPGVYTADFPEVRYVTQRSVQPVELSPATKEHKAQVQAIEVDVKVAKKEVTKTSGMYSPADKSDRLEKVDSLIQAVKKARQRANQAEAVNPQTFGATILDYILS